MRLTLLIPELLWSEPGDSEANAPAGTSQLAKILAQRHFTRRTNEGWEATLLRLAGLHAESSLASLRALGDGIEASANTAGTARWLCADPVHLRFHQNRLVLADGHELALAADELSALAQRLNAALAGRAEFFFAGPTRGYVRVAATSDSDTDRGKATGRAGQALSRKIGCEVRPSDFGSDPELRGLANEIQMLLHADPLNQAREAAGQPSLNALWLWGDGESPRRAEMDKDHAIDAIAGQHPLIGGIARTLGIPHLADGESAARHTLHFIDTLSTPTHYQDSAGFAKAWQTLSQQHFDPALSALRRWRLQRLDIVAPVVFGELDWQLSPVPAWLGRLRRGHWTDLVTRLTAPDTTPPQKQQGK